MRAIPEAQYNTYMKSAAWSATRRNFLWWCRNNGRLNCWFCGKPHDSSFHAHHIRYERFGNENIQDLALVCAPCHTTLHNAYRGQSTFVAEIVHVSSFKHEIRAIGRGIGREVVNVGTDLVRSVIGVPKRRVK